MKFLTTGQFAKFCGTSKDTLIFYDRQGLLRPGYVSENGYRRYRAEQFYDFDLISMLKETGSSLAEIKDYLQNRDPNQIVLLLEEKKQFLKRESERLARRQTMLEEMSLLLREALHITYDTLSFADLKAERLEIVPIQEGARFAEDDGNAFAAHYSDYVSGLGGIPHALYGVMINEENLAAQRYIMSCFFHRSSCLNPQQIVHTRPKGRYAMYAHQGDIKSHIKAYRTMLAQIAESGFSLNGPMYAHDVISYLVISKTGEYATKYCVRVE